MEFLINLLYLSQHRQNTALRFVITRSGAVNRKVDGNLVNYLLCHSKFDSPFVTSLAEPS